MASSYGNVQINCDLGEGIASDASLMPFLHACSIGCGGHVGDVQSMTVTVKLALKHNVKVGAHPSFPDKENFGRKKIEIDLNKLETSLIEQIRNFEAVCSSLATNMHHIKLHGALYNIAANDETMARMVVRVLLSFPGVLVFAPFNSVLAHLAMKSHRVCHEAFIDRSYNDDGSLVYRTEDNALITSPEKAWLQLHSLYTNQSVKSIHGKVLPMKADTFCIHGDNESALEILEHIHTQIQGNE